MTKMSLESRGEVLAGADVAERLLPPSQRDGSICDLYAPGHQFHYTQHASAPRSRAVEVRDGLVDGTLVTLVLADGTERQWRHHDPERLRRYLELMRGQCWLYDDLHSLRVGPYWFNCASELDDWADCDARPAGD